MANLPGIAWLDEDGHHIWFRHQCTNGETTNMLPWPHWHNVEGVVHPSISCTITGCGFHSNPLVREHPADWESRSAQRQEGGG